MDLNSIWQDYGLERLEADIQQLFPEYHISLSDLMNKVINGDILGAVTELTQGMITELSQGILGMKNIFIWILILGIVSAMMTHFVEVFDTHQVADLSFYFIYLLLTTVLLECFIQAAQITLEVVNKIVEFIQLFIPAYLLSIGIASGTTTVSAYSQLILLVIYGVENILLNVVLPLAYSFCLLSMINGIWAEEKLGLFIELLEKGIGWILKASVGLVTGFSIFQAVITPVIDSAKKTTLQKIISAIPGVGNVADGVAEVIMSSAVIIKNGIGIVFLVLLFILCAVPLLRIFLTAALLKGAAAFMGIVSDKRITACANRTGDAGMILFRIAGTALLLFFIILSIAAAATNKVF